MSDMPDKYVDYTITSPPYNMKLRILKGKYVKRSRAELGITKKYQTYSDDLTMPEYFEWQRQVIGELLRVTKKYVFYNIQMVTGNKVALFQLIGQYAENIKEIIIWDKCHAEPAINSGVLNSQYEFIIIFSANVKDAMSRSFEGNFPRGTLSNLLKISKNFKNKNSGINSAMMNPEVPNWLIQNFTTAGEIIFDPFCGFGTTLVESKKCGRQYIGCDVDQKCCEISVQQLCELNIDNLFF